MKTDGLMEKTSNGVFDIPYLRDLSNIKLHDKLSEIIYPLILIPL